MPFTTMFNSQNVIIILSFMKANSEGLNQSAQKAEGSISSGSSLIVYIQYLGVDNWIITQD